MFVVLAIKHNNYKIIIIMEVTKEQEGGVKEDVRF